MFVKKCVAKVEGFKEEGFIAMDESSDMMRENANIMQKKANKRKRTVIVVE